MKASQLIYLQAYLLDPDTGIKYFFDRSAVRVNDLVASENLLPHQTNLTRFKDFLLDPDTDIKDFFD